MRISDWSSDVCSSDLTIPQLKPMDQSLFEKGLLKSFFEKRPLAGGLSDDGAASSSLALADLAALGASSLLRGGFKASATRDMKRAASPSSEERRVGKECVSTCRSRGSP